jgi:hypothetical protein
MSTVVFVVIFFVVIVFIVIFFVVRVQLPFEIGDSVLLVDDCPLKSLEPVFFSYQLGEVGGNFRLGSSFTEGHWSRSERRSVSQVPW